MRTFTDILMRILRKSPKLCLRMKEIREKRKLLSCSQNNVVVLVIVVVVVVEITKRQELACANHR